MIKIQSARQALFIKGYITMKKVFNKEFFINKNNQVVFLQHSGNKVFSNTLEKTSSNLIIKRAKNNRVIAEII